MVGSSAQLRLRYVGIFDHGVQREVVVDEKEVRPLPPATPTDWISVLKEGDPLEVLHLDGWCAKGRPGAEPPRVGSPDTPCRHRLAGGAHAS